MELADDVLQTKMNPQITQIECNLRNLWMAFSDSGSHEIVSTTLPKVSLDSRRR